MDVVEKIKRKVTFTQVLIDLHPHCHKKYSNNYLCPFCGKETLSVTPNDDYGFCHYDQCRFSGDVIGVVMRTGIPYVESIHFLCDKYGIDKGLQSSILTVSNELKKDELLDLDLKFLQLVRMYMGYYKISQKEIMDKHGIGSSGKFSDVVNGNRVNVSPKMWTRYITILRYEVNLDRWRKDLNDEYFFKEVVSRIVQHEQHLKTLHETLGKRIKN